jgi:CRISPR/Cas system Type II protein with McrA/HNH and RuvC-like nuclease domain
MQQYRRNHPEQMKFIDGAHHHKRRALKKNAPGNFTPAQIREQLQRQRYRCYYLRCGQSKFPKDKKSANGYRFTIEHLVPLNRTELNPRNDISNIVLACESCNASKRDKLPHEWSEGGRLF